MIELKEICKSYGTGVNKVQALKHVSLTINQGEMVAIMGKSGSGKSTLLYIIGTLDQPTSGSYQFKNHNVTDMSENKLAKFRHEAIGFVFQGYFLLSHKTAIENVELPLLYSAKKTNRPSAKKMLQKVSMGDRLTHKPSELSGGQCQRVAIARALINTPYMILADEPTGALDSNISKEIINLFRQLNHEGQTIVIVTHDEQIGKQCDRCIHLADGKIIG